MKETLLITGAGGYVGTHLVEQALDKGYHVKALDTYIFGKDKMAHVQGRDGLTIIQSDIRGVGKDLFKGVDFVADLAGFSNDPSAEIDPDLTRSVNFGGCTNVAKMAKGSGVKRYVEMSSCSVYGANEGVCDESTSPNPQSLYAQIKAEVEEHLMGLCDNDFCATALRNSTCFGLSNRMRYDLVVNLMSLNAFKDRSLKVFGSGNQRRPLIHAADSAAIVLHLLEQDPSLVRGEIFNIGSENTRVIDLADRIRGIVGDALGEEIGVEHVGENTDVRDYEVCFAKFTNRFGIVTSLSVEDGSREIIRALMGGKALPNLDTMTLQFYQSLMKKYGSSFLSTFSQ